MSIIWQKARHGLARFYARPIHAVTLGREIMICDDVPLNSTKFLLFPGIRLAPIFIGDAFFPEKNSPPQTLFMQAPARMMLSNP